MSRLHIHIKDDDKAPVLLNLLRELPFVEIENDSEDDPGRGRRKARFDLADLFGIWENRSITLKDIRDRAWTRVS